MKIKNLDFYNREDRPWQNPLLDRTAIIGHVTESTAKIWVQVRTTGKYKIVIDKFPIDTTKLPSTHEYSKVLDTTNSILKLDLLAPQLTGVYEILGLNSDTEYFYAIFSSDTNSWEMGIDNSFSFTTQMTNPSIVNFGLFSCHMPYEKNGSLVNMHMWNEFNRVLTDYNANFIIGCGDQVYTDGNKKASIWQWLEKVEDKLPNSKDEQIEIMLSWYRDIYRGFWGHNEIKKVFRKFPTYMIWDDHEIMDGWGSYTKSELANELDTLWEWQNNKKNIELANRMREAAGIIYNEYQHSHNPNTPESQYDYTFKQSFCSFFTLDMRGCRDYNRPTNDKVLGPEQMERFLEWLSEQEHNDSAVLFINSPVPVIHVCNFLVNHLDSTLLGLADDLRDEWEHESNWVERDIMLDAIFKFSHTTDKKVFFLSGDVHIGASFKLRRDNFPKAKVFQLTSSGITYARAPGWLLRLAVKDEGVLGHKKDAPETKFKLSKICDDNNFAFIQVNKDLNGNVEVAWDLYANTGKYDEITKQKRIIF